MTDDQASSLESAETSPVDEAEEVSAGEETARIGYLTAIRKVARGCLAWWRPILAASLVTAVIGVAAGVFFFQYRPDQQISDAAAHQAVQAASDGAVAVVSYSYANLDRDFAKAKSHSTGEFLAYYTKFSQQYVAPAARRGNITATATVLRAALSELHPDSAVVLVFLNQTTVGKEKREPLITASSVSVTLAKVNGSWLIAKLDPL
jgi:Mce-associated membrane protein